MINLFLVDGASGTGKSDLVEYVRAPYKRCGVVIKATTRKLRDYEEREDIALDLSFYSKAEFDRLNLHYMYEYGGESYGFSKRTLDQTLTEFRNVFAIIRSIPLMKRLKADYRNCRVVTVYIRSDLRLIEDRMRRQGRTQQEIEFRKTRIAETFADYERNTSFFDEIIENSSDKNTYYVLIDNLLAKYS